MRTIIAGSRTILDYDLVEKIIRLVGFPIIKVICGGSTGPDLLGAKYAKKNKITVEHFPADWKTHGKAAGPIRNTEMEQYCDGAIIIWTGDQYKSPGSWDMIKKIHKSGKPYATYNMKEDKLTIMRDYTNPAVTTNIFPYDTASIENIIA